MNKNYYYSMKVDVHNHIGIDPEYEEDRTADELIKEMEKAHVDKCIVFPFTSNPDIWKQNEIVKEAMKKYPEKLIGFFTMSPGIPDMADLMYEYKNQGFKGVVTDPRFGEYFGAGSKCFHELVECALVLDLPVWIHADNKDTMRVSNGPIDSMLSKFGGVKFILSSMYYEAENIAARHGNVFIDTASGMSPSAAGIQTLGTHRILMGSNTPYGLLKREIDKIIYLDELTDFQKSLIFWQNAKRLIRF